MTITMTAAEFKQITNLISNIGDQTLIRQFNKIFESKDPNREIIGYVNKNDSTITIVSSEKVAVKLLSIIASSGKEIGHLSKHGLTITNAPKWISLLKKLKNSILGTFH